MEERWLWWLRGLASPALDAFFGASHYAGTMECCVALVLGLALWHRRRGELARCRVWLWLGLAVYFEQAGLKLLFERARPELWLDGRWSVSPGSFSFPSGHALAAATFFPLLAISLTSACPARRWLWWPGAALLVVWVGVGRLYLGVHWPSDVAAGWSLGLAQVALASRWASSEATAGPVAAAATAGVRRP